MTRHGFALATTVDAEPGSNATILSDLSANIFAALLIVLILLLQLKAAAERSPAPARPIAVERALQVRPHTPLQAVEIVAMLRARGADAAGPSFDLVAAGLRRPDGTLVAGGGGLGDALQAASSSGPVRLYVFSPRWFDQVTASLAAAGRPWRDLSVPRALRAAADSDAWLPAFVALASRGRDDASFRAGLARLLTAGSGPLVRDGHVAAKVGGAAEPLASGSSPARSSQSIMTMISLAFSLSALTGGGMLVMSTEWRARGAFLEALAARSQEIQ